MADQIKFEVGEKYENMKGVFEVIAIRRNSMDIRWEDGEEIQTPIDLQRRIIERMRFEKEMEEAEKAQKAKKAKASSAKGGKQFVGLEDNDFSNLVSKTTWRGRGQLGGAVAIRLKSNQFKFNSWAVLRKPEVSWMDIQRQKQDALKDQAKYYARVEKSGFFYGFQVHTPETTDGEPGDWHKLITWLEKPENVSWLTRQCTTNTLRICDLGRKGFVGELMVQEDRWVHVDPDGKEINVESVPAFLTDAARSGAVDVRIERKLDKEAAIGKKEGIASDIAALFETLMPLYAAVSARNG